MDNNNLFTNMFGVESEETPLPQQKKEQIPTFSNNQPTTVVEQPTPVTNQFTNNNSTMNQTPFQSQTVQPVVNPPIDQNVANQQLTNGMNSMPQNQNDLENPNFLTSEEPPMMKPVIHNNPEPIKVPKEMPQELEDKPNIGLYYVVFLIILLICIFGPGLYSKVGSLTDNTPSREEIKEEQSTTEEPTTPVDPENTEEILGEPSVTEPTPEITTQPIEFDDSLKFYKGITTNELERNQEVSYLPENTTGVIKCSNKKPLTTKGAKANTDIYLYYEEHLTKKMIQKSLTTYTSNSVLQSDKTAYTRLRDYTKNRKSMKVSYSINNAKKQITTLVSYNLVYGNRLVIPNTNYYLETVISYNDGIERAMDKLMNKNKNNITCSTVITE